MLRVSAKRVGSSVAKSEFITTSFSGGRSSWCAVRRCRVFLSTSTTDFSRVLPPRPTPLNGLRGNGGGRTLRPSTFLAAVGPVENAGPPRRKLSVEADATAFSLFGPRPHSWWTGCRPNDAPGMQLDGQISSLPQPILKGCSKQALQDYFDNTWVLTESLFASLQGEEAFLCPPAHGLRHPFIFYYGHAAVLYVNKLRAAGIIQEPVNAYFESLLEMGVDEMAWDDMGDEKRKWPSVWDVHAYRCDVYNLVCDVIASAPDDLIANISMDNPYWALVMAFEHERLHIETSSVLIRELPLEHLARPATWPEAYPSGSGNPVCSPMDNPLKRVEAGSVTLGKPKDFPSYGWDNEYGLREFSVPAFEGSKHMVSNGEFMEFVRDSGYGRRELWTESGWGWKISGNVKRPKFWIPQGPSGLHQYSLRTLFDEVSMPWDWPAIVNFHEAKAFAKWKTLREEQTLGDQGKSYRLATELEHSMMRGATHFSTTAENPEVVDPVLSTARHFAFDGVANMNLISGSESPVNAFPPNKEGFHDMAGNAWEWCEDHFAALNGFSISPLYEDFSIPFFDGKHHMMMGGSFASSGGAASVFTRMNFRPHFHQHAGFRLVAPERREEVETFVTSCTDAPPPFVGTYPFRTSGKETTSASGAARRRESMERSFAGNVAMHFTAPEIAHEDATVAQGLYYPKRCAQVVLRALEGTRPLGELEVVEVGCGAGGASFELSKVVRAVVALDESKPLIDAASTMARDGRMTVECPSVNGSSVAQEVALDDGADPARVTFTQCDPMSLPAGLEGLDAALIHSVIDTVSSPNTLLARMGGARGLVRQNGGVVVVVSAYDWNEEITPRGAWLGGYLDENGKQVPAVEGLSRGLGEEFKLIHVERVPRITQLSDRVFEYASAEATVWRRN